VAANPGGAKRIADAGMEIGNHTWEHPNITTIPPQRIPEQLSKANDAIAAATSTRPTLLRTAGGLINDAVLAEAKKQGLADINGDVIPFDWINDANIAATIYMLKTQIKPGSLLLHDTYSSAVDVIYQFMPLLKANGYHLVTVSKLLGPREPGSSYGSRANGPPANDIRDIPPPRSPPCPIRRRRRRCPTSRSPIFPAPIPAAPTTAPDSTTLNAEFPTMPATNIAGDRLSVDLAADALRCKQLAFGAEAGARLPHQVAVGGGPPNSERRGQLAHRLTGGGQSP
jgi:Polysaccharide deacetylase